MFIAWLVILWGNCFALGYFAGQDNATSMVINTAMVMLVSYMLHKSR